MSPREWIGLAIIVGVCLLVGGIGSVFTGASVDTWYSGLKKPSWTPPSAAFGPVWTVLYILMGVAAWLVWRRYGLSGAALSLALFAIQLALNLAWSGIFFGARAPEAALVEIVLLWIAILATMISFWRIVPLSGWLMLPYLLWVSYAVTLNYGIVKLNP